MTGCASLEPNNVQTLPKSTTKTVSSPSTHESEPIAQISFQTESMTLSDLINLASQTNPDLQIASTNLEMARGRFVQAGLYLNPRMIPEIDNVWDNRNQWGEPGITFAQEFITGGKRRLDQAAAFHGIQAADWNALTQWFVVITRIRQAYYELLTAERVERATNEIVRVAQDALDAAKALKKAGAGNQPDVLRATVELGRTRLQLTAAQQRTAAARRMLAAAVGVPELSEIEFGENTDASMPHDLHWDDLITQALNNTSPIQESIALVQQAERQLQRAKVQKIPNVDVQVRPFFTAANEDTRAFVSVGVPLPIFDRNQGNIQSAQARLAQAHSQLEKAKLTITEQLTKAFQRYQVARRQVASYRTQILPDAEATLKLIQFGYKNGDPKYDYTALLQAQQILFQSRLGYEQSRGEFLQAISEIEGILQTFWRK